ATLSEADADRVFAIHGEIVAGGKSAARVEGQIAADALVACLPAGAGRIGARRNLFRRGFDVYVADGQAADALGHRHIPFEQGRREGEYIADVVEAVAGIVR